MKKERLSYKGLSYFVSKLYDIFGKKKDVDMTLERANETIDLAVAVINQRLTSAISFDSESTVATIVNVHTDITIEKIAFYNVSLLIFTGGDMSKKQMSEGECSIVIPSGGTMTFEIKRGMANTDASISILYKINNTLKE